jgi:hypothetical protein
MAIISMISLRQFHVTSKIIGGKYLFVSLEMPENGGAVLRAKHIFVRDARFHSQSDFLHSQEPLRNFAVQPPDSP